MKQHDHPHYYHLEQEALRRVQHHHARPERQARRGLVAFLAGMTARLPLLRPPFRATSERSVRVALEQGETVSKAQAIPTGR